MKGDLVYVSFTFLTGSTRDEESFAESKSWCPTSRNTISICFAGISSLVLINATEIKIRMMMIEDPNRKEGFMSAK